MTDVPETRWATTVDGASIAYQDFGGGPTTLVVVHGFFSHLEVYWELPQFAAFMRRLSKNVRVLHFDKRGLGMSDRLSVAPSLDIQMDDIRAVMDAAGVDRAALCAYGAPGPELAAFFAATHPARTLALWLDGGVHEAQDVDYPWGEPEQNVQTWREALPTTWGNDAYALQFAHECFGDTEGDAPFGDGLFLRWLTKMARFSATPTSIFQFERMWLDTDVRGILPTVSVPAAVMLHAAWPQKSQDHRAFIAGRIPGAKLIDAGPGAYFGDHEQYVTALERFIESVQHEEAELDRMLATVMLTDVVGSTDKACELGDRRWTELLERHNATVRAFIARYRGLEVNTAGDGFLATFDGPARAVRCAQGICEAVRPLGLEVRAGCHTGEIELLGADVGGIAVRIGARIGALAGPSEVLVSSTVKDLVAGSGLVFSERGEHELKGVPGNWHLYSAGT